MSIFNYITLASMILMTILILVQPVQTAACRSPKESFVYFRMRAKSFFATAPRRTRQGRSVTALPRPK